MSLRWVSASELDAVIGPDGAEALCRELGGLEPYLARHPRPKHKIVQVIGMDAAKRLAAYCGGNRLDFPNKRRQPPSKERIWDLLDAGASHQDIARECDVTTRWVRVVARNRRWAQRQLRLPICTPRQTE